MKPAQASAPAGRASTAPLRDDTRNYPYNCWWVAALSDEVDRTLLSRWMLEMPVLLYRKEDGTAVAMEDRCPHRSTPLSMGRLHGDNVVCGYHGFEFAPGGKCVRVPTQPSPGRITARTFPVIEQYPFIWIYTGDVDRIDDVPKPMDAISWGADPASVVVYGYTPIDANYMLLKENVLDISHVPIVHMQSLEATHIPPTKVSVAGDIVTYAADLDSGALPLFYRIGSGFDPEKTFDNLLYGCFVSPALQTSSTDIADHDPGPSERAYYQSHICHLTTPIDMTSMHYWWVMGRDYGDRNDAFKQQAHAMIAGAFDEDKLILEAIQTLKDRMPTTVEYSVAADAAPIEARRALQRWMDREAGEGRLEPSTPKAEALP